MPEFIAGCIWGAFIAWLIVEKWIHRNKQPFRWYCPEDDCYLIVSSNDPTSTIRVAEDHKAKFHSKEN